MQIQEIHTAKKLTPFKEHPCNIPSYCLPVDDLASSPRLDESHLKEEFLVQRGKKLIPSPPDSGACTPRLAHTGYNLPASCTTPDQRRGKRLITPDDIGSETALLLTTKTLHLAVSSFYAFPDHGIEHGFTVREPSISYHATHGGWSCVDVFTLCLLRHTARHAFVKIPWTRSWSPFMC